MPSVYFRNNDGFSLFFCTLLSNLVVFFRLIFFSRHAACVRSVLWTVEVFKLMTSSVQSWRLQVFKVEDFKCSSFGSLWTLLKCSTKCLPPRQKKRKKVLRVSYVGRMIVIHAIKLCDSLESVTTSTVFINCIEITSTVQTLRSKTLQVLWTDANYSSVHKYSFEFWTLQPFRNGKNRQEQFICSHEFWTLQTFKVTKKSQKQFKWSGL